MKWSGLSHRGRVAYLYILPWIVGFAVFQLYPFAASLLYSFTDLSLLKPYRFIGWDNYRTILGEDPVFRKSLWVTIKFVIISVPLKISFALFIAVLLNQKLRGIQIFKTFYYLPSILGASVGISILWRFLFNRTGLVNMMLAELGIGPIDWLGQPDLALYTVSMLSVWQFGSSMVLFLAALQQVPSGLYEAAKVDGAGRMSIFFKMTIPLISPIILFNLVMQTINAFQEFAGPFLITGGGPIQSTYLYSLLLYDTAFKYLKMGYSSALSWILFLIILAATVAIFKTSRYWTHYEDGGKF